MSWPKPEPGLVIRYAYLWRREAASGLEEGLKDRPCAVVLTVLNDDEERIYVLPITHTPPLQAADAVEIPAVVKSRLGLDGERSWIVLTETNSFLWPGPDLRFQPGLGPESSAYGFLPPRLFSVVRDRFIERLRSRRAAIVRRSE